MAPSVATRDRFWIDTFEEHGTALLAFLTNRTGRRDLAEDLLQETFVRAMRKLGRRPAGGNVRSYLFTTASRLVIDHSRRKRPALISELTDDARGWLDASATVDDDSYEQRVDLERAQRRLAEELERLPPEQRVAFEHGVLRQQAYAEIAREQGWTVNKVKINVYRARKRVILALRDQLAPGSEQPS